MRLEGANPAPTMFGEDIFPGKSNYFIGNDPKKWRTNISNFKKVRYQEVYPGIDLVYYGNQRQLEYDFIVSPGADPKLIQLSFAGMESYSIENGGDLVLHTSLGDVIQQKPVVYQDIDGKREMVAGNYIFLDDERVAFHLGDYDKTQALVIDPVLVYSTFLGGNSADFVQGGIAVDAGCNSYVTGGTFDAASDFPTTAGAFDETHYGSDDVFVVKLNPAGGGASDLLYSTFLGGNSSDIGNDIAVDGSGNAYVTWATRDGTIDFPTTGGAFDEIHNGSVDVFVSKIIPISTNTYWSLINPEGESAIDATYGVYDTLGDMLNDTNRLGGSPFTPNGQGEGNDIVGSGSDGTDFWNLFNPEGESATPATYATYATRNDMLADINRLAGSPFTPGSAGLGITTNKSVVGSGSDGTTYWNLVNLEGESAISAEYKTFATLADMLADTNRTGSFNPTGGGVANNIVGSGATNQLSPVAVAGPDQTPDEGDPVTLDGSGSLPDPNFLNFDWTQTGGTIVTLNGSTTVNPTFTAPLVGAGGETLTFQLIVDIGGVFSNVDTVDIFVQDLTVNGKPVANAGIDQIVEQQGPTGSNVALNGSASSDPDGDSLTFAWTGPFGATTGEFPNVLLPAGVNIVTLVVNDGTEDSDSDDVQITVQDTAPPVITLLGISPATVEAGTAYVDAGATASDNIDGNITGSIVTGGLGFSTAVPGGPFTVTYDVTDGSGNPAVQVTRTVNLVDTAPPVVTPPENVTVFAIGPLTPADLGTATAVDSVDGAITPTASPTGPFPPGQTTVTWSATDVAGNTGTATQTVNVVYSFSGFEPPIDNLPIVNSGKAGKTVPVKWNIPDGNGGFIRDLNVVSSINFQSVVCDSENLESELPLEDAVSGGSGLRYDLTDEHFVFNWKTSKSMAKQCFVLILTLNDGSQHLAKFSLK